MQYQDWLESGDKFLKEKEIEIHGQYHTTLLKEYDKIEKVYASPKRTFRINAFKKALKESGRTLSGRVLEIGAGDGWFSAFLMKEYGQQIDELYSMEINDVSVKELIPHVFDLGKVDKSKLIGVRGSFNRIPLKNHFDFVIAMGAVHHTENLYVTLTEIYSSLKDNGIFIFQEPTMEDSTEHSFYEKRLEADVALKGSEATKNSERGDILFRKCEYLSAGFHAGFNMQTFKLQEYSVTTLKRWWKELTTDIQYPYNGLFIGTKDPLKVVPPLGNWEEGIK